MNRLNNVSYWMFDRFLQSEAMKTLVGVHPQKKVRQFYEQIAYEDSPFPYGVYIYMTGREVTKSEGQPVLSIQIYQIKFYAEGYDYSVLEEASNDVEPFFTKSQVESPERPYDQYVAGCRILRLLKGSDPIEGVERIYLGSELEVTAYA